MLDDCSLALYPNIMTTSSSSPSIAEAAISSDATAVVVRGSMAATSSSSDALLRSNLLRLEISELLHESSLFVRPGPSSSTNDHVSSSRSVSKKKGGGNAGGEVKWANDVRRYIEQITETVHSLDGATLSPSVALLSPPASLHEDGSRSSSSKGVGQQRYYVPLTSDKFLKSIDTGGAGDNHNSLSKNNTKKKKETAASSSSSWSFPFAGGSSLQLSPIGSYGHVNNAGLTRQHANGAAGNVVPTLDMAVLFDASSSSSSSSFVSGKDYLNSRYTDKRNILAVYIGKQLSQKKYRHVIGSVHLTRIFGDANKVGLILTPPTTTTTVDERKIDTARKRKRNGNDDDVQEKGSTKLTGKKKTIGVKNKPRFRIRLIFGVKEQHQQQSMTTTNGSSDNNGEESAGSDDDNGVYPSVQQQIWIPLSRLLPNRNNNRAYATATGGQQQLGDDEVDIPNNSGGGMSTTPHYTNSIAEDIHFLSTTRLINMTIASLSNATSSSTSSASSSITTTTPFHETLLLLKIWSLQRGYLRGHDTFTTTTLGIILTYLYRTKVIGRRMGCIQSFVAVMKFWSETDWLGEDDDGVRSAAGTSSVGRVVGGGASTVTGKSALDAYARKLKKKAAFVIPDVDAGWNEAQTASQCDQARRFYKDVRSATMENSSPGTLLDCYKACYATSLEDDMHHDSPVLLDTTMTINYLARLSSSFVRESRAEARAALAYIHAGGADSFDSRSAFRKLFLETNRFWTTRYDAYVRIPLSVIPRMISLNKTMESKQGSNGTTSPGVWGGDVNNLGYDESVCRGIVGVLSRALGDRATFIRVLTCGNGIDIRGSGGNTMSDDRMSNDDAIATNVISDSDQCHTTPFIHGNNTRQITTFGYAAHARCPSAPALLPLSNDDGEDTEPCLVIGVRIDPNASRRIVDRGPPVEDVSGTEAFTALWGEAMAQLRRFQDGAIVRAVVWNDPSTIPTTAMTENIQFAGGDRSMGGIVERIIQHIVSLHFTDGVKEASTKLLSKRKETKTLAFELRNMISFIDGASSSSKSSPISDSLTLHKNVMTAFDSLVDFLRKNTRTIADSSLGSKKKNVSKLGMPLAIDEVEPLSPCLRYSALFPPKPHPLLGGNVIGLDKRKVSGANDGSPILIQIRFEGTSKWPASMNAMGAAKCAMLIQLAEGIDKMKRERGNGDTDDDELSFFDGPMDVTFMYLDIGYRGYSWRIIVRADQELRMLRSLRNPTVEAKALRLSLINRHVRAAMHHSLIRAIYTRHPTASSVVRLAHRWVASHLLSDMIPHEAIELIVGKIYTETSGKSTALVYTPPATTVAGFLRFLHLLSTHDWAREPLIVDPQNHINYHDRELIHSQFTAVRGSEYSKGPAMYIIFPADYDAVEDMVGSKVIGEAQKTLTDNVWAPTVTSNFPEKVVLRRAAALAKCSHDHLTACIIRGNGGKGWAAAFHESHASIMSFSALLRVEPSYITDPGCSSTNADATIDCDQFVTPFERCLQNRSDGVKGLRKKFYKNLVLEQDTIHEWRPVRSLVNTLRARYNDYAVFFYNEFSPDIIAIIWRPDVFKPQPFSVIASDFKRPTSEVWKEDSPVITNVEDLMAEIAYIAKDIVTTFKVFDEKKS